eukprot:g3211.t1
MPINIDKNVLNFLYGDDDDTGSFDLWSSLDEPTKKRKLLSVLKKFNPSRKKIRIGKERKRVPIKHANLSQLLDAIGNDLKTSTLSGKKDRSDPFRQLEKHYRDTDDFKNVLDFANLEKNTVENRDKLICISKNTKGCEIFTLKNRPGFYFIRNFFTLEQQISWIKRSIEEYSSPPHRTNLHAKYDTVPDWISNVWKFSSCKNEYEQQAKEALLKLSWSTLGYHYDWTKREYPSELMTKDFPEELSSLTKKIASYCGYNDFRPEAAICNFYNYKSVMGGHYDEVEENHEAPVVSISFGNTAIFLLGNPLNEKYDENPLALYIRSGDCVVMGGKSRLCKHGIPRILENTLPKRLREKLKLPFSSYMNSNGRRINLNVRQVKH